LPSRRNQFGGLLSGPITKRLSFHFGVDRVLDSGFVNGNVLVPLASERGPQSSDSATDAIVAGLLRGFPSELPNLSNVSERSLNTNALRDTRSLALSTHVDYQHNDRQSWAFEQRFFDDDEQPFQLVAGGNPLTLMRPQSYYATYSHSFSPESIARLSLNFD